MMALMLALKNKQTLFFSSCHHCRILDFLSVISELTTLICAADLPKRHYSHQIPFSLDS